MADAKESLLGGERPGFNFLEIIKKALGMSKNESLLSKVFTDSQREDLEEKIEPVARGISSVLAEFWNIPKGGVLDNLPKVRVFKEEEYPGIKGTMTLFDEYSLLIIVNAKYLTSYEKYGNEMLNSIEPALAEEICHYMEWYIKKEMNVASDPNVKEFFGMVSRLYVADKLGYRGFNLEYRRLFEQALNFKNDLDNANSRIDKMFGGKLDDIEKELTAQEDLLDKSLKSGGVSKESEEIKQNLSKLLGKMFAESHLNVKDIEQESVRIKHMTYHPAYAYYYQIIKMKPEERFALLSKEPSEIVTTIMEKQEKKLEAIKRLIDNSSDKDAELDKIIATSRGRATGEPLKSVETGGFLESIAKHAGFRGSGRGETFTEKELMKQQWDREVNIEMQGFVTRTSFKLADFWGMPNNMIEGKIPSIDIIPDELFEKRIVSIGYPSSLKENGAFLNPVENKIYISSRFMGQPYGFNGWKAVLGEEVGHFIEGVAGEKSPQLREFFGGICKYFISETDPIIFKYDWQSLLRKASLYNQTLKKMLENQARNKQEMQLIEQSKDDNARYNELKKEQDRINDEFLHIWQNQSVLYYFKIRNEMTRQERYELITNNDKAMKLITQGIADFGELDKKFSVREGNVFDRKAYSKGFQDSGQFFENTSKELSLKSVDISGMTLYHGSGTPGIRTFLGAEETTLGDGIYLSDREAATGYAYARSGNACVFPVAGGAIDGSSVPRATLHFRLCVLGKYSYDDKDFEYNRSHAIGRINEKLRDAERLFGIKIETTEMPVGEVESKIEWVKKSMIKEYPGFHPGSRKSTQQILEDYDMAVFLGQQFMPGDIVVWPVPIFSSGNVAFMNYRNYIALSFSGVEYIVIQHEIGHILGLTDNCDTESNPNPQPCIMQYTEPAGKADSADHLCEHCRARIEELRHTFNSILQKVNETKEYQVMSDEHQEKQEEELEKQEESEVKEAESEMIAEDNEFQKDEEQSVNNELKKGEEFEKEEEQSVNKEEKEKQEKYNRFSEEESRDLNNELSQ